MSVSKINILTTKDLAQKPHLQHIDLSQMDSNIDLPIGNNVPNAYAPFEVRRDAQHALKTLLG